MFFGKMGDIFKDLKFEKRLKKIVRERKNERFFLSLSLLEFSLKRRAINLAGRTHGKRSNGPRRECSLDKIIINGIPSSARSTNSYISAFLSLGPTQFRLARLFLRFIVLPEILILDELHFSAHRK